VVVTRVGDVHIEGDAAEVAVSQLEHEPVAPRGERGRELADAAVGVGHRARDRRAVSLEDDRHSGGGTAGRGVQHVRRERRAARVWSHSAAYRTPAMRMLRITAGRFTFTARLEEEKAPKTCEAIRKMLPLRSKLVHCRWSGESTWVPLGERRLGVDYENHTSHPAPGQLLVYPGGISEMEILFPYGSTMFASKVGQLAGNHFATVVDGNEQLAEVGRLALWEGAQDFSIELA